MITELSRLKKKGSKRGRDSDPSIKHFRENCLPKQPRKYFCPIWAGVWQKLNTVHFAVTGVGPELFLSVAWPTGVQLLVFFCSSVPVVLFDTPGISRCRSQHVSVESSSLLHHSIYLWFICFTWWSIDELENLHADRTTVCFEPW